MRVPLFLLILSLGVSAAAFIAAGMGLSDLVLLGLLSSVAALILVLRDEPPPTRSRWIVVDGSNVMHWQAESPSLETVSAVLDDLTRRGFVPLVGFDANVGYLVSDRYMGPHRLAQALGIADRHVFVAPKGMPADPLLLKKAGELKAQVVTNDRYRDWTDAHPAVSEPGFLVPGQVKDGRVTLRLP